jgi:FMN-dependent oxidoreductase (nitrilotriacetate monooxygenase family)
MSNSSARQIHLGLFLQTVGHHVAGWRHPEAKGDNLDFNFIRGLAEIAEGAKFDMVFLADGLTSTPDAHPSMVVRFDPVGLHHALAQVTHRIGLVATSSTTYNEPYYVARSFASLDHISQGRAAWNIVTTSYERTAANFSRGPHPDHAQRYEIAEEFVSVVQDLWDSWEDDAFVRNKQTGEYFIAEKQHAINHQGRFFSVKGPLNVARPPQGHPVLVQAGSSEPGQALAARKADIVFTAQQTLEEAQQFYRELKSQVAAAGRDPSQVAVMPGVFPIVGQSAEHARERLEQLQQWADESNALSLLSERLGTDISGYPLDGPLPEDLPVSEQIKSRSQLLIRLARRDKLTLRQLYHLVAGARGHRILLGTPEQIADGLQEWFEQEAADGFNIMPAYFPAGLTDFTQQVVPILQRRGLFRRDYSGQTLREHLGLARPAWRVPGGR